VAQKLSRAVSEYRSPSPVARAAAQLEKEGRVLRPGQMIRFVYLLGGAGVHAWDLQSPPDPARLDFERYSTLLLRAAATILQPFGMDEALLRQRVFYPYVLPVQSPFSGAVQLHLWPSGGLHAAERGMHSPRLERTPIPEPFGPGEYSSAQLFELPAPFIRSEERNPAIECQIGNPAPAA
jgi:hypothetical protein